MIDQRHINNLNKDLKKILDDELNAGNIIDETWDDWPEGWIFVGLKKSFQIKHDLNNTGLKYLYINDPHYWKEEINSEIDMQAIVTGFE
jgi:hypothetical protein